MHHTTFTDNITTVDIHKNFQILVVLTLMSPNSTRGPTSLQGKSANSIHPMRCWGSHFPMRAAIFREIFCYQTLTKPLKQSFTHPKRLYSSYRTSCDGEWSVPPAFKKYWWIISRYVYMSVSPSDKTRPKLSMTRARYILPSLSTLNTFFVRVHKRSADDTQQIIRERRLLPVNLHLA
jgi:hypothetical protein